MTPRQWAGIAMLLCAQMLAGANALQQCEARVEELGEITELARQQIEELQALRKTKDAVIEEYRLKIRLLNKRIEGLQEGDEVSATMIELLRENQQICLATESQAYQLMQGIMRDYQQAVDKATRPWFLKPAFYGGLLLGALAVAAL